MPDPTVSLDSDFTVYASIDTADTYMDAAIHGDLWRAATDDTKGRALVTSTRLLDRQLWKAAYNTYALRLAVPAIVSASIEIALALIQGSPVQDSSTMIEKVKELAAGSVRIINFRGVEIPVRFPQIVQELLGPYLAGSEGSLFGKASGVDGLTIFPVDLGFSAGI